VQIGVCRGGCWCELFKTAIRGEARSTLKLLIQKAGRGDREERKLNALCLQVAGVFF